MTIPARPALATLCHVPSLRAEASLPFVVGRKCRFALRAERRGQIQGLILANGPVPSRKGGNAAGPAERLFLAIPTSQGARDMNGWPSLRSR